MIEFNRNGEAMQVLDYNLKKYEKQLSRAIAKDLNKNSNNRKLIAANKTNLEKDQ